MAEEGKKLEFEYRVSVYSGPEEVVEVIEAKDVLEADEIVRDRIAKNPAYRAVIYPRQKRN
jgi:hypothetical protein